MLGARCDTILRALGAIIARDAPAINRAPREAPPPTSMTNGRCLAAAGARQLATCRSGAPPPRTRWENICINTRPERARRKSGGKKRRQMGGRAARGGQAEALGPSIWTSIWTGIQTDGREARESSGRPFRARSREELAGRFAVGRGRGWKKWRAATSS